MSMNALHSLPSRAIIIASSIDERQGEGWGGIKLGRARWQSGFKRLRCWLNRWSATFCQDTRGSAVKMDGQGARHSQIDFEIPKDAMLCYSILALVSIGSYTSAPWNGTSFPQDPVAVMAGRHALCCRSRKSGSALGCCSQGPTQILQATVAQGHLKLQEPWFIWAGEGQLLS